MFYSTNFFSAWLFIDFKCNKKQKPKITKNRWKPVRGVIAVFFFHRKLVINHTRIENLESTRFHVSFSLILHRKKLVFIRLSVFWFNCNKATGFDTKKKDIPQFWKSQMATRSNFMTKKMLDRYIIAGLVNGWFCGWNK